MHQMSDINQFSKQSHSFKEFKDKLLIFGGWQPYQNLPDIQMYD